MAKLAFSALVDNAEGRLGTIVLTSARNGHTARVWRRVRNPRTGAQSFVRNNLAKAARAFSSLTPEQADAWNDYGQTITRTNPLNGKTYHPAGVDVFVGLATKFLQFAPTGTIPVAPPTSDFLGDTISLTVQSETPGVIQFDASAANAAGVTTELLIQKLPGRNRVPNPEGYTHAAFKTFTSGSLSINVDVTAGHYAIAYRFVRTATGQMTNLFVLPITTINFSVEKGGVSSTAAESESAVAKKKKAA